MNYKLSLHNQAGGAVKPRSPPTTLNCGEKYLMNIIQFLLIAFIVIFTHPILCFGFANTGNPIGSRKITVEYSQGCGICLWNLRLILNKEGTVTDLYTWGLGRDKTLTKRTYKLTEAEKHELDALILDAHILELNDEYACKGTVDHPCPTDMGWEVLKFTTDDTVKRISWNWVIPEKLAMISKKIKEIRIMHVDKVKAQVIYIDPHDITIEYSEGKGINVEDFQISINTKGAVTYYQRVKGLTGQLISRSYQLTEIEKNELDSLILDKDILSLGESFYCQDTINGPCPSSLVRYILRFTIDGMSKYISGDLTAPQQIELIREKIKDIRSSHIDKIKAKLN